MTEQLNQTFTKSSVIRRLAAFFIDHFVMTFLMVAIIFLSLGTNFLESNSFGKMTSIMLLVMGPGFFLYFAKDSYKGISIGRWIMGIMVRSEKDYGSTPSFWKLFIRNLFLVIWPVEVIVLAVSDAKKRLGDNVADTIVLKNPDKPKRLPRILALIGVGIVFFAFIFLFVGSAMKNSGAYKVAVQNIETNQEIIKETGGITGYGMMPSGNINISNGYGQAQLQITVVGKNKDITVSTYLEKEPFGPWKLIQMNK